MPEWVEHALSYEKCAYQATMNLARVLRTKSLGARVVKCLQSSFKLPTTPLAEVEEADGVEAASSTETQIATLRAGEEVFALEHDNVSPLLRQLFDLTYPENGKENSVCTQSDLLGRAGEAEAEEGSDFVFLRSEEGDELHPCAEPATACPLVVPPLGFSPTSSLTPPSPFAGTGSRARRTSSRS